MSDEPTNGRAPDREEEIFEACLARPTEERAAYLDQACAGDAALRQRLEELLRSHGLADSFLEGPPASAGPRQTIKLDLALSEKEGDRIGRYKLLQQIGEGGCGVVYMAEQEEPVRRRVALKVIKLGMDTRGVIARFEAERQALALMDHPNIAKVLDAGATDTGRPFFVMELVRGIKITEYCDQNHLDTRTRLGLFIQICQAIQHAHQKGIIHRDIKPSNILVTMHDGVPVPKVIDFGIAKATTDQRLTDKTLFTAYEQFIGTPAYMSPEQAEMSGLDIDTRSDIYSLGVLLYELLAGSTPFDATELMSRGIEAMRKTIREKEPVRPSTRFATLKGEELTTTANRRSADTAKLLHQLKGDLDWIVMKCLEKDRTRRYETANGLATDLKRHLENEPVLARPPSAVYKFQKAIRRNKLAYAAGLAVTAALVVGTAVSVWQAKVAIHALTETEKLRLAAQQERDKATLAQAEAEQQRNSAETARQKAQAESYAADVSLADEAMKAYDVGHARQLLERHHPAPGEPDLRNWEWRYLWQKCRSDAALRFMVQTNGFANVAVSHDGHWLAVGGMLGTNIFIFDISAVNAPRMVGSLPQGDYGILAFSPRAPLLAYSDDNESFATNKHRVHLWNCQTQTEALTLVLTNSCGALVFSPDGERLVTLTGTPAKTNVLLTAWRCSDGIELKSVVLGAKAGSFGGPGQSEANGYFLAVAPDLATAVYGSSNNLYVVDLAEGTNRWKIKAQNARSSFSCAAISPDGRLLAATEQYYANAYEVLLHVWDMATGEETQAPIAPQQYIMRVLRFLHGGRTLLSAGDDHTIRLWDVSDPQNIRAKGRRLLGHQSGLYSLAALSNGKTLISGDINGAVCVWDITAERRDESETILPANGSCVFAPDGQSLFAIESNRVVQWHGPRFEAATHLFDTPSDVGQCEFSSDGRLLVTVSTNGVLQVYDLQRGRLLGQTDTRRHLGILGLSRKTLLAGDTNQTELWDLDTFQIIRSWPSPASEYIVHFRISEDGQWVVMADYTGMCTRVSIPTGDSMSRKLGNKLVVNLDLMEDGSRFVTSSYLGYAQVWDTRSLQPVAVVGSGRHPLWTSGFSRDGTRFFTTDLGTGTLRAWDIKTERELITFPERIGVRFSPDGNLMACREYATNAMPPFIHIYRAPTLAEIDAAEAVEKQGQKP
jgi:eukaryotic-like serine/threonine-protein kinase